MLLLSVPHVCTWGFRAGYSVSIVLRAESAPTHESGDTEEMMELNYERASAASGASSFVFKGKI